METDTIQVVNSKADLDRKEDQDMSVSRETHIHEPQVHINTDVRAVSRVISDFAIREHCSNT